MHLVAAQFQMPLEQIFENVRSEISNVCAAINGRPARIHSDWTRGRIAWLELLNFPRIGVKKLQRHVQDGSGGLREPPRAEGEQKPPRIFTLAMGSVGGASPFPLVPRFLFVVAFFL